MKQRIFAALERLAGSSWGKQGVGAVPNEQTRKALKDAGYAAHSQMDFNPRIMRLTINGFRALEAERWRRKIEAI